jgi:hypothetical protein
VTRYAESAENTQSQTHFWCPVSTRSQLPSSTFHSRTVWSDEVVATYLLPQGQMGMDMADGENLRDNELGVGANQALCDKMARMCADHAYGIVRLLR